MIRAELASELAAARVTGFSTAVSMRECDISSACEGSVLDVEDSDALLWLLGDLASDLAGSDWAEKDDSFEELCLEAGLDYQEVLKPPSRSSAASEADLRKKELGDLGELLALLHVLSHLGWDPRLVLSKNALKLYERVSEPGIDILCFAMDLDSDVTDRLLPADEVLLVESKVGQHTYHALSGDAADYLGSIDAHHWQRELRLAQASLSARGATATARRLRFFLPQWPDAAFAHRLAFLVSDRDVLEPVDLGLMDAIPQGTASLMQIQPDEYREGTFGFRRPDDA